MWTGLSSLRHSRCKSPPGRWIRTLRALRSVRKPATSAVQFIRAHAAEQIRVDQVLDHVPLSRRALELRFKKALGRSQLQEITRARLHRAMRLLVDTDWPMPDIADATGFATAA